MEETAAGAESRERNPEAPKRVRPGQAAFFTAMAGLAVIAAVMWRIASERDDIRVSCVAPYVLFWIHGAVFVTPQSVFGRWAVIAYAGFTVFVLGANLSDFYSGDFRCGNSFFGTLLTAHLAAAGMLALDCVCWIGRRVRAAALSAPVSQKE